MPELNDTVVPMQPVPDTESAPQTTQASPIPTAAVNTTSASSTSAGLFWKGLSLVLLLVVIVGGTFMANSYWNLQLPFLPASNTNLPSQPEPQPVSTSDGQTKLEQSIPTVASTNALSGATVGKIFYSDDKNIFSYDTVSLQTEQLTQFTDGEAGVKSLNVLNNAVVTFGRCYTVPGDYGCKLYWLDVATKQLTMITQIDKDFLLESVGFYDKDTYAYNITAYTEENNSSWQLVLVDGGQQTLLEDIRTMAGGRGGTTGDDARISFSPSGMKLLHISTATPRDVSDFNIYVYTLGSSSKQVVTKATQAHWLSDDQLLYAKTQLSSEELPTKGGLYIHTLSTGEDQQLTGTAAQSYFPDVLAEANLVSYTDYEKLQIQIYDMSKKAVIDTIDQGAGSLWLSPSLLLYQHALDCEGAEEECGMGPYRSKELRLYNLQSKTSQPLTQPTWIFSAATY